MKNTDITGDLCSAGPMYIGCGSGKHGLDNTKHVLGAWEGGGHLSYWGQIATPAANSTAMGVSRSAHGAHGAGAHMGPCGPVYVAFI